MVSPFHRASRRQLVSEGRTVRLLARVTSNTDGLPRGSRLSPATPRSITLSRAGCFHTVFHAAGFRQRTPMTSIGVKHCDGRSSSPRCRGRPTFCSSQHVAFTESQESPTKTRHCVGRLVSGDQGAGESSPRPRAPYIFAHRNDERHLRPGDARFFACSLSDDRSVCEIGRGEATTTRYIDVSSTDDPLGGCAPARIARIPRLRRTCALTNSRPCLAAGSASRHRWPAQHSARPRVCEDPSAARFQPDASAPRDFSGTKLRRIFRAVQRWAFIRPCHCRLVTRTLIGIRPQCCRSAHHRFR